MKKLLDILWSIPPDEINFQTWLDCLNVCKKCGLSKQEFERWEA